MQPLEIKAIEMEDTAFRHLDGFVHDHALYFLIGVIYLLLALFVWVLCGGLRPKGGKSIPYIQPGIIILPGTPPPPPESLNPPIYECNCNHDRNDWAG
jgi:hypothetical protein